MRQFHPAEIGMEVLLILFCLLGSGGAGLLAFGFVVFLEEVIALPVEPWERGLARE